MDDRIKSIIERRKKLGWTLEELAEKAELFYEEAFLVEEKGIYNQSYISKLSETLDEALEAEYRRQIKLLRKNLTKEFLIREYLENERSLDEIAKECAFTRQYVYKKLIIHGIQPRNKSSARKIALRRGKIKFNKIDENGTRQQVVHKRRYVNENFFSEWNDEMAYVLGFIYADGNLDRSKKILSIAQKDPEILYKILNLMDSNAKIYARDDGVHYIQITNKKIISDLSKIGLIPNKSLSIDFPNIPSDLVRHFIRGCWDGDGSVHKSGRGLFNIRASYVSGSLSFIKGMLKELENAGLPPVVINTRNAKNPYYSFKYSGSQCEILFHYLYDEVSPNLYLSRKYEIFFDYFGQTT